MQVTNDIIHISESSVPPAPKIEMLNDHTFLMSSTPAVINTIRRIILDETPTLAFDTAVIEQNTSVIPDEVLCQRFAMLPLLFDPRMFQFEETTINEENTVVFRLDFTCTEDFATITSDHLAFIPIGGQTERFKHMDRFIMFPNIPIAKLGKLEQIKAELYAHKGIGKVHAKWSPVSVCYFQMLPWFQSGDEKADWEHRKLALSREIECPQHVFDDMENLELEKCTLCRKCLDCPDLKLFLDDQRFILHIESTCCLSGAEILVEALKVMKTKAALVIDGLTE